MKLRGETLVVDTTHLTSDPYDCGPSYGE